MLSQDPKIEDLSGRVFTRRSTLDPKARVFDVVHEHSELFAHAGASAATAVERFLPAAALRVGKDFGQDVAKRLAAEMGEHAGEGLLSKAIRMSTCVGYTARDHVSSARHGKDASGVLFNDGADSGNSCTLNDDNGNDKDNENTNNSSSNNNKGGAITMARAMVDREGSGAVPPRNMSTANKLQSAPIAQVKDCSNDSPDTGRTCTDELSSAPPGDGKAIPATSLTPAVPASSSSAKTRRNKRKKQKQKEKKEKRKKEKKKAEEVVVVVKEEEEEDQDNVQEKGEENNDVSPEDATMPRMEATPTAKNEPNKGDNSGPISTAMYVAVVPFRLWITHTATAAIRATTYIAVTPFRVFRAAQAAMSHTTAAMVPEATAAAAAAATATVAFAARFVKRCVSAAANVAGWPVRCALGVAAAGVTVMAGVAMRAIGMAEAGASYALDLCLMGVMLVVVLSLCVRLTAARAVLRAGKWAWGVMKGCCRRRQRITIELL